MWELHHNLNLFWRKYFEVPTTNHEAIDGREVGSSFITTHILYSQDCEKRKDCQAGQEEYSLANVAAGCGVAAVMGDSVLIAIDIG